MALIRGFFVGAYLCFSSGSQCSFTSVFLARHPTVSRQVVLGFGFALVGVYLGISLSVALDTFTVLFPGF